MKISKIAVLCRAAQRITLWNTPGNDGAKQWLGDGNAIYPCGSLPDLDEKAIYIIFDVEPKDRKSYIFKQFDTDLLDLSPKTDEPEAEQGELKLSAAGAALETLLLGERAVFFESKYLSPLAGDQYTLHIRDDKQGKPYIVCKSGMLVTAAIQAFPITDYQRKDLLRRLKTAQTALDRYGRAEYPDPDTIRKPYKD